jgi:site-specific recombinase XerD
MKSDFASSLATDLAAFLSFKRTRGYRYARAEFTLRTFDRFLRSPARRRHARHLDQTILAWLASRPDRQANSVAMDLSVIREFWRYLHRRDPRRFAREPRWPRLPTAPQFLAHVLSLEHVRLLLRLIGKGSGLAQGTLFGRKLSRHRDR